jgi:hypothetical protein
MKLGVIYITTNIINGKKYIGSDSNNDKYYLGSGVNLKKAIKKYGRDNFKKSILCECPKEYLREMEEYYCNYYNVQFSSLFYNCTNKGLGSIHGSPHKKTSKEVFQYDLNGNFITKYNSYTEALNSTGFKELGNHLSGKQKTCRGYIFLYDTQPRNIPPHSLKRTSSPYITQMDDHGEILNTFNSIWDAGKIFKCTGGGNGCGNIRNSIRKGVKAFGYYWKEKI